MFYATKVKARPSFILAPFIDVVFLLLIFFMVATVFPENDGVDVQKPKSDSAKALPNEALLFLLTKEGDIYYDQQALSRDELRRIVADGVTARPDVAVIVKADTDSATGDLVLFLDEARRAGAENISIAAELADKK